MGLGRVKPPKWPAAVTEINSTRHSVFRVEKITLPCGRAFYSWGDLRRLRIFFLAAIRWPTWRSISNAAVLRPAEDLCAEATAAMEAYLSARETPQKTQARQRSSPTRPRSESNHPRALLMNSAIFASPSSGAPESKAALFGRAR